MIPRKTYHEIEHDFRYFLKIKMLDTIIMLMIIGHCQVYPATLNVMTNSILNATTITNTTNNIILIIIISSIHITTIT